MPSQTLFDLARSVRMTLACAALGLVAVSGAHAAELNGTPQRFDIPAQSTSDALDAFSKQTGLRLLFSFDELAGKHAGAVRGEFTAAEALTKLLAGTGLVYEINADSVVLIKPRKHEATETAHVLETINVFGTLDDEVSVGSKTGLSLRETPKSVTIVSRDRIEAQNLTTIADAMGQATGVTLRSFSTMETWYYARGYRVTTTQLDGGAPITDGFGNLSSPDSAAFESIEVLRGVDGMFSGAGDPGGVINLVRKRALSDPQLQVNASIGRWDNYRAEVDVTGGLMRDGAVRGRLVAVYEDKDYFLDRAESDKYMTYGVIESDLGERTVLSLGGSYEHRRERAFNDSGLPRYADGRDLRLPRETNLAPDWASVGIQSREAFAKLEHQVSDDLVARLNVTYQSQDSEFVTSYVEGPVNPFTRQGATMTAWFSSYSSDRVMADLFLKGKVQLFSREHTFAIGADYSESDGGDNRYTYDLNGYPWGERPVDVLAFDPAAFEAPVIQVRPDLYPWLWNSFSPVYRQAQQGFYATFGLQLTDALKLVAGARYTEYEQEEQSYSIRPDGTRTAPTSYYAPVYEDDALVPSVALTYEISDSWSAYGSYAETFKPQANLLQAPTPGSPLEAITGDGVEVGVKGTLFQSLNTAVALYRVQRNGEGVRDSSYPYVPGAGGSACCFLPIGDVTTEGADVEVSGRILPSWQMFAGYTYSRTEYSAEAKSTNTVSSLSITPKHLFKLWTTWSLPGALANWTLNGGVNAQSEAFVIGSAAVFDGAGNVTGFLPFAVSQGGYATWNASLQYRGSERWSLALYVDNLFDKTYYSSLGGLLRENRYGTPRNVTLRLQTKF